MKDTCFQELAAHLQQKVALSHAEIRLFWELAHFRKYKKNQIVLEQGQVSPFVFICKGCLMTYHQDKSDFKHVIQFGLEQWWTGDIRSMQEESPSFYGIKALSPAELLLFDHARLQKLLAEAPVFEQYFRILFQNSLISHQKRIIRNISFSAEERYEAFWESFPKLELVVPQKYIASYLGITPEFLSKMKTRLYTKNLK